MSTLRLVNLYIVRCNITIIGHYYPTAKNGMVKDFYGQMEVDKICEDEDGNSDWELIIDRYQEKFPHMKCVHVVKE